MKIPRRRFLHLAAGAGAATVTANVSVIDCAWSQAVSLKFVVPYAAGGGGSVLARVLTEEFERTQGWTTIVENRPGGGTVIGTEAVARSAPDAKTLLITNPPFLVNPLLRRQRYDPLNSFEPICRLVRVPIFILVNSASPYQNLNDLLSAARAKPGELTLANFPGSLTQIGYESLKRMANVDMVFVPFPGSAPAANALLGGHVTALYDNLGAVAEHVKAGTLRALAVGSRDRLDAMPEAVQISLPI
jgi:tripartite-type tricarboxylate transporter receptor subunit TctC